MDNKETLTTIKTQFDKLKKSDRVNIRNKFLETFGFTYPSWYVKLKADRFRRFEREFLKKEIEATNTQNIN